MYCYSLKPKSKILPSILHISAAIFMVAFFLSVINFGETNAFFSDTAKIEGSTFSAGYWIPVLTMTVSPENPDGEDGFYKTTPCVTLSADINDEKDGIKIYYEFSADGNPIDGGTEYAGTCIEIPDGNPTHFQAQAVNEENDNWKSNIVSQDFKVRTGAQPGDVIINEVMWMGSDGNEDDQWIELKNTTDEDIHIKGWYLTYKSDDGDELKLLEIKDDRVIKSGEYFLASYHKKSDSAIDVNPDSSDLADFDYNKFQIKLYTSSDKSVLIDTAGDGTQKPKEGDEEEFFSMERKSDPGDGSNYDNWYTCEDSDSNKYWDDGRLELGTPGHENMSDNDLSSLNKKIKAAKEDDSNIILNEEILPGDVPADDGAVTEEDATAGDGELDDAGTDETDQPVEEIEEPDPVTEPEDVPVQETQPEE